jgi:hypothetical protein
MHEMANHSFLQPLKPDLIETLTICCLRSKTRQIKKDRPMDINRAEFQYFLSRVVSIGNFSSGDFIRDDSPSSMSMSVPSSKIAIVIF